MGKICRFILNPSFNEICHRLTLTYLNLYLVPVSSPFSQDGETAE